MDRDKIERAVRDLHGQIWQKRKVYWPDGTPNNLVDMLEPEIAAKILGVEFEHHEDLGQFGYRGDRFETAGLLDRRARKIAVSMKFSPEAIRFTGAHEIGHWLLHPDQAMYRERPIKGLVGQTSSRPPQEKEADYFAGCFLVPPGLVEEALEFAFSSAPFVFDDTAAFWLCPSDPESLLRADDESLDRALAVASTESYGGRRFISLARQFRVSPTTMAIRLRELELIQE